MNKNKGLSYQWILLPILFSSVPVLAGGFAGMGQTTVGEQASALSAESDGFLDDSEEVSTGRMNYVGGDTRIGVGIDTEFKGRIDGSHIFMQTEDGVTSGQGWLGINPRADDDHGEEFVTGAGAKINHHWVTRDGDGTPLHVNKVFGAYDQNEARDKKISAGYGQEREHLFWSGHVSKGLSDKRVVGAVKNGSYGGAHIYEKAYDFGVGGRVGTFVDDQLLRVQGGLDYEWGSEIAAHEDTASQLTISGGLEKFFPDSPHSIGANVEFSKKSGGYEYGDEETDINGQVSYRYDFGGAGLFASEEQYRRVRVEIPGKTERVQVKKKRPAIKKPRAPKVERKLVKHTMELESDTFFERGKHYLTPQAKQRMSVMMARIRETGHHGNIRITGNTCDLGSDHANQALSERRAAQVRNFMVANGFNANELVARGLGESSPKYPNTESTRHRNRRVDIEYVAYQSKYEDKVVQQGYEVVEQGYDIEEQVRVVSEPRVVWRKELIPSPPTWVSQALRNNIQYKQRIDTYRTLGEGGKLDNRAPVAVDDAATTTAGSATSISVLNNDTDADGDILTISSFDTTSEKGGTITETASGVLTYTPAAGFTGVDSFTYTVSDGHGGESTATVLLNVDAGTVTPPANSGPVATADDEVLNTTTDNQVTINVLGNDTDPDGDTLTISAFDGTSAQDGTVAANAGQLVYTPQAGFTGTDTFTYTISDGNGGSATGTVTVVVSGDNPTIPNLIAQDDSASTTVGTPVSIDVLDNDSDFDGDPITISTFDAVSVGDGTVVNNNGQLVYTPQAGFTGTDTFTYTVTDGTGNSATATVTVVVSGGNNPNPGNSDMVARNDSTSTPVNTPVTVNVLSNDSDPDGDVMLIERFDATSTGGGSIAENAAGQLVYTPAGNFTGTDTFTYTATDGNGEESTATVTITVTGPNPPDPAPHNKPAPDNFNVDSGMTPLPVLTNDTVDGNVTIHIVTHPSSGTIQNESNGNVSGNNVNYMPQAGATGTDTFTYALVDEDGLMSDPVTVTVTLPSSGGGGGSCALTAADDGTVGELPGDAYSLYPGDTVTRELDVLANDQGCGLTIVDIVSKPRFGTAQISADGKYINYTLRNGYCEDHTFVYRVRDENGNETEATVYINVVDGKTCTSC